MLSVHLQAFVSSAPLHKLGRKNSLPATCLIPVRIQPTASKDKPAPYRPDTPAQCARDFITQRAVQQTIFCAFTLRDETTARWLDAFLGHTGIHDLHACEALRFPSREYINKLFCAPPEHLTIKKPIPGRTFRDNPYLKRRYLTYEVDVVPRTIARRLLEARQQIADELVEDLETILTDDERLTVQHRRSIQANPDFDVLSIDLPPTAEKTGSPYRSATLDLAQNYTLYLALKAISGGKSSEGEWVNALLQQRAGDLLHPYGGSRGMSDQVIREMLSTNPTVRTDGSLFDPCSIAEQVFEQRLVCIHEWSKVASAAAQEHLDIERSVLEDEL